MQEEGERGSGTHRRRPESLKVVLLPASEAAEGVQVVGNDTEVVRVQAPAPSLCNASSSTGEASACETPPNPLDRLDPGPPGQGMHRTISRKLSSLKPFIGFCFLE